jgi:SAM-dependent methyltransferase
VSGTRPESYAERFGAFGLGREDLRAWQDSGRPEAAFDTDRPGRAPGAAVLLATAERLPFAADAFTAAAMPVVFFFFTEPLRVLAECRRVLRPGGRLAVFTTGPQLRGTPGRPGTAGHPRPLPLRRRTGRAGPPGRAG